MNRHERGDGVERTHYQSQMTSSVHNREHNLTNLKKDIFLSLPSLQAAAPSSPTKTEIETRNKKQPPCENFVKRNPPLTQIADPQHDAAHLPPAP